jgi:hypothetical protein
MRNQRPERPDGQRFKRNASIRPNGLVCALVFALSLACGGCPRSSPQANPTSSTAGGSGAPSRPPTASCSVDSPAVQPGESVSAQVYASDPNGQVLTYRWSATGGAVKGNGSQVSWIAPQSIGTFTIYATATNAFGGDASCAVTVTVLQSAPPPPPPPPPMEPPRFPMPQLPKLPDWTLTYTLPDGLAIQSEQENLGTIYDRIRDALTRAGISSDHSSTYAVGADGFAVVTHVEYIDNTGVPLDPRWSVEPPQKVPTTLSDFWHALIDASPGRYRVMVIVVTAQALPSLKNQDQVATPEEMGKLLSEGNDILSQALRDVRGKPDRRCVAIIYEFYRPSSSDAAKMVDNSVIGGPEHLASAGLWPKAELP